MVGVRARGRRPGHRTRGASGIVTLVERATRYVLLGGLPDSRISAKVICVLTELMGRIPTELAKTLTWDQGIEMRQHAKFTLATDRKVCYRDPPLQGGSNENTNGMLRHYFLETITELRTYSQADLDQVARELNRRSSATLNLRNPAEALDHHLVTTAH